MGWMVDNYQIFKNEPREYHSSDVGKGLQMNYGKTRQLWISETAEKARTPDKMSDGNTGTCREQRKVTRWIDTSRKIAYRHRQATSLFFRYRRHRSKVTEENDPCGQSVGNFLESVNSWPVLSVEPEGVRCLESLRKPANQARGSRLIIAVRRVGRHATEPQTTSILKESAVAIIERWSSMDVLYHGPYHIPPKKCR